MALRSPFSSLRVAALLSLSLVACSSPGEDIDVADQGIIGGSPAEEGAWPGTVALYGLTRPICGGSLVAERWVLTAAHCINPWQSNGGISKVVVGKHRLSSSGGQAFSVQRVFRHPSLRCNESGVCDNDVALLLLSGRASAPKAKLVAPKQLEAIVAGMSTVAVGWGYTSESDSQPSDVLRQVTVPLISGDACAAFPGYATHLTDNMLCTNDSEEARGSCKIDSGSPLFVTIGEQVLQIGLTSWGRACARTDSPTVYARIGHHLEWMERTSSGEIRP